MPMQTFTISATPIDPNIDMDALMAEIEDALGLVSGAVFTKTVEQPVDPKIGAQTGRMDCSGPNLSTIDSKLKELPAPGTQRQAVLLALLSNPGGLTPDEIVDIVGCANSAVDGRVLELLAGGFISRSDERRPTPYGGQARVLFATDKARLKVRLAPTKWLAGKPRPEGC